MNYQKKTVWSSQMRLSLYLQNKMTMNNMKKPIIFSMVHTRLYRYMLS